MTKVCTKCGITKDLSNFHKQNDTADGYRPRCKSCRCKQSREFYISNATYIRNRVKNYRLLNIDTVKAREKIYKFNSKIKYRPRVNAYMRNKTKNDINFRILRISRKRIWSALTINNIKKTHSTIELL